MSDPGQRPLRVLCVVPRGLAGRGGIETLFSYVKTALEEQPGFGLEMEFVASRGDAGGAGWVLHFPFGLLAYAWRLATGRFDVVHLNVATNASAWRKAILQTVARMLGKPVVVHFHGSAFPRHGEKHPAWAPILGRIFRGADGVIVLGGVWRDFLAGFYTMPLETFSVVANGVPDFAPDAPAPHQPGRPVALMFAGNLTAAKGADTLLDALARLPRDLSWHAVMAGAGDVAGFEARARERGLAGRVSFTGWVEQARIKPMYREADIVVLPSRGEVLPVCLIEGACAGAALVATPVGSVPDVVGDGVNGFLVPVGDTGALADRLALLIGDPRLREGQRAASRRVFEERFRLETMIGGLLAVYRGALARK